MKKTQSAETYAKYAATRAANIAARDASDLAKQTADAIAVSRKVQAARNARRTKA